MSTAEAWPTETAATAAVEAAAKKAYEARVAALPEHYRVTLWEGLSVKEKLDVRNSVLAPIWAALEALPDPRYTAWEEGYLAAAIALGVPIPASQQIENPYPSSI